MIFYNNIDPVLLDFGFLQMRWYGLFFAIGIALNYMILMWIFKREKYPVAHLESLVIWLFFGLLIGARMGEVLFYEAPYYLANPAEILQVWHGGLSSHGAAIGLFIAFFFWCRKHKLKFSHYADAIVIPMPLTAAFVRLGNFFNSEIVGVPTSGNFGVVFERLGEDFARHPAQLYEGAMSLIVFVILFFAYRARYGKWKPMTFVSMYIALYFGGRFVTEFWKDLHGPLPTNFPISMGQLLSLVPIAFIVIYWSAKTIRERARR